MSLLWTLGKVFDKVPHNGLLYKLFKYGIDDITLQWLKHFLEKRRQSLVPEGEHSHNNIKCTPRINAGPLMFFLFLSMISCAMLRQGSVFLPMTLSFTLQ